MIAILLGLLSRSTPCTPRCCDRCNRTATRLTQRQAAQIRAGDRATCGRRLCRGRLTPISPGVTR